jgi:hypothetical protein
MTDIDTGLNVWQMTSNHNRMIALQADSWIDSRVGAERIAGPRKIYQIAELDKLERAVHFFGDQVDFDKDSWREGRD